MSGSLCWSDPIKEICPPHVCAPAYSEGVENAINTGTKQWHERGKQLMDLKIGRS